MTRRDVLLLSTFGLLVAAVAAAGIGVRASHNAQTTADEPQYLLTAMSLWEDGNLDISDELDDRRYREFHEVDLPEQTVVSEDGSRISPHDPLLPIFLAAPMGLGGWVGAKAAMAAMGGLLASLVVWTARRRLGVSERVAYVSAGLFALAPPLAVYTTQIYPELPAALVVLIGFTALVGPLQRGGGILLAVSVLALPWLAVKYVPLAAVLAIAGLIKAGRGRRLALVATFAAGASIYVLGHLAIYGGITAYASGDHFVGGEFTAVGTQVDLWGRSTRLIGLLVDRGFGIGAWQPAFLLLPLVAGWALGRRRDGFALAGWLLGASWLVATFAALTMHGWWFPGRQLVVVLPIAVLLIASWADASRTNERVLSAAGAVGIVAFVFLAGEGLGGRLTWVVDFAATANPIYRVLATVLPDYMSPTATTWVLHGIWVIVALMIARLGWRSGAIRDGLRKPEPELEESQRKALT